jgi:hypothetical protein
MLSVKSRVNPGGWLINGVASLRHALPIQEDGMPLNAPQELRGWRRLRWFKGMGTSRPSTYRAGRTDFAWFQIPTESLSLLFHIVLAKSRTKVAHPGFKSRAAIAADPA